MILRDWLSKWRFQFRGRQSGLIRRRRTDLRDLAESLEVRLLLTNLQLSNNTVPENSPVGTYIGSLTTSDPAPGETFTYTLVTGTGSTYNNYFQVNGDTLKTRLTGFNFESSLTSYSIRVRSVGSVSGTVENTFTINVTDVNEQVTLNNSGSPELTSINNQDFVNPGDLITNLITSMSPGGISDPDIAVSGTGIAVIGADSSHGTWELTTDSGATWFPLGAVSDSNASLLASDMNTRIRFVPDGSFEGRIDPAITFRAWDRTIGTNGSQLDLTPYLGGVHLSAATETASLIVRSERAVLLTDVNLAPVALTVPVSSGGFLYYVAIGEGTGRELWRTDGTPEGTKLVRDIALGEMGSDPASLTDVNGVLYFSANNGVNGKELWKTDGTFEGTVMVADFNPGKGDGNPLDFHVVEGILYFTAVPASQYGNRVFILDPSTDEPVWLEQQFSLGDQFRLVDVLGSVGSNVFFQGYVTASGYELYKYDSTTSQVTLLKDIAPGSGNSSPRGGISSGNYMYFIADDGTHGLELWRTDGTTSGTILLKDIVPGSGSGIDSVFASSTYGGVIHDGLLYFSTNRSTPGGRQLWRSDGTEIGTTLVLDVPASGNIKSLTSSGEKLYFTLSNNAELWTSDGTAAGTQRLRKFTTLPGSYYEPAYLTDFNGSLYFSENDGVHGRELWRTDGTVAGTVQVFDQIPGFIGSTPTELTVLDDHLIYFASDDLSLRQLWRTDGSLGGAEKLFDYAAWTDNDQTPAYTFSIESGGLLYFSGQTVEFGTELWVTDGTSEGTRMVLDISPGESSGAPFFLASINGLLYFAAQYGASGFELWVTDGTTAGTHQVKEINTGGHGVAISTSERKGVDLNGTLLFLGIDTIHGTELWKSDGTASGTVLVKDINPGGSSNIRNFVVVAGVAYFIADDGVHGEELWRSDGTAGGTYLVADVRSGSLSSSPTQLVAFQDKLFFQADDGVHGKELWKSDGTQAGTVLVSDILPGSGSSNPDHLTVANGRLFFSATDSTNGLELWSTDGTTAGTQLVKDIQPGTQGASVSNLVAGDGILFFTATSPAEGNELWKTDGTLAGTLLVKDIRPGSRGSGAPYGFNRPLFTNDGYLYFGASSDNFGGEIWKSDGTAEGTSLVMDLLKGPRDSRTGQFYFINGSLVFLGNDGIHGYEFWAIPNRAPTLSTAGNPNLSPILEDDITNSGTSIAELISALSPAGGLSDPDSKNFMGVAIIGTDPTAGTWEFSTNGGATWGPVGAVSQTQARLLWGNDSTKIRLIPNPNWNGQVDQAITFRGWDRTFGRNGDLADTTLNGGRTSFSPSFETAGIFVTPVNDPPSQILLSANEVYEYLPVGTIVGTFASIDIDSSDPFTYQLVAGAGSSGNSMFTVDGNVLKTAAVLSYFDFQNFSIRVRSTDQQGGSSEQTFTIKVLNVNDAPVLDPDGSPQLDPIAEDLDADSNDGIRIIELILRMGPEGGITDIDPDPLQGIAVLQTDRSNGHWEYRLSDSQSWSDPGQLSVDHALLLAADQTTRIRFVPNSEYSGQSTFSYVAWDRTAGDNGGIQDASSRGGTTSLSLLQEVASISVFPVDDPPHAIDDSATTPEESPTIIDLLANDTDIDTPPSGLSILPGSIGYRDPSGIFHPGMTSHGGLVSLRSDGRVDYVPPLNFNGVDNFVYLVSDGTSRVATVPVTPVGEEVLVRSGTEVDPRSQIAMDANGNFVIVWQETSPSTDETDIFAQRYDSSGKKSGEPFRVNSLTAGIQEFPSIAMGPGGEFAVALRGGTYSGVVWQPAVQIRRFDKLGNPLSGDLVIPTSSSDSAVGTVAVAMNESGAISVVWSEQDIATNFFNLFGMRFTPEGNPSGAKFMVNTTFGRNQSKPDIALQDDGSFLIVWQDFTSTNDARILGQRFNASGMKSGGEFVVNTATSYRADFPAISKNSIGDMIVTWTSRATTGEPLEILAQRFHADGSRIGNEFTVNSDLDGEQGPSRAALQDDGSFVIVWDTFDNSDASPQYDVMARRFDRDGSPLGSDFRANSSTTGEQYYAKIAIDHDGDFVIVWEQYLTESGIAFQRFKSASDPQLGVVSVNVTPVNDAPSLNPNGNPTLDTITLNVPASSNPGTLISTLIARMPPNGGITDVDAGALQGIAINGLGGIATGIWQFTIDGGAHWAPIGSTGNSDARLLAANPNTRIRYLPNTGFVGEVKLTFVAWDQTSGTNGGVANVNNRGGSTAFSANYEYASLFVVNSAPVLNPDGNPTLTDIPQGTPAANNPGTLVSEIIARMGPNGGITDINPGALKGIAVNGLSGTGTGIWQFSTDGGSTWLNFGSTGNLTARLLAADGLTRIRYTASTSFLGEAKFAFVAWDRTIGVNGGTANVSSRGGTTPFSANYDYASQFIVNTAPELNPNGNPTLNSILGGVSNANNPGTLITDLIARMAPNGGITDPNLLAVKGIAINGLGGTSTGVWEYSINNGTTWSSIGTTGNFDARLLAADANTRIRYRPNVGFLGEVKLAFVAWDRTSGTNGGVANVNLRGGTTAFSINYEYASLFVVNSAPVLTPTNASYLTSIPMNVSNGANTGTLVSDLITRIGPNGITDPNPAALQGIAINGLGGTSNGLWQYSINGGVNWSNIGTTGNSDARLLAANANTRVRFVPNLNFTGTVKLAFVAWDQTSGVNGGIANVVSRGGTTAFSTLYDYASLSVV